MTHLIEIDQLHFPSAIDYETWKIEENMILHENKVNLDKLLDQLKFAMDEPVKEIHVKDKSGNEPT